MELIFEIMITIAIFGGGFALFKILSHNDGSVYSGASEVRSVAVRDHRSSFSALSREIDLLGGAKKEVEVIAKKEAELAKKAKSVKPVINKSAPTINKGMPLPIAVPKTKEEVKVSLEQARLDAENIKGEIARLRRFFAELKSIHLALTLEKKRANVNKIIEKNRALVKQQLTAAGEWSGEVAGRLYDGVSRTRKHIFDTYAKLNVESAKIDQALADADEIESEHNKFCKRLEDIKTFVDGCGDPADPFSDAQSNKLTSEFDELGEMQRAVWALIKKVDHELTELITLSDELKIIQRSVEEDEKAVLNILLGFAKKGVSPGKKGKVALREIP